jgi:glycosyltransferase involved in cell wall biosynthesis
LRILVLFDGINGVAFHRLYTPYARLQLDHDVTVDICQNPDLYADLQFEKYDCVIFNRWLGKLQYNVLPLLAQKGIPYICDNDDYWVIPRHNPAYPFYREYLKNSVKDAIHYADAVQVTTPQLLKPVKEINDKAYIIPNALDLVQMQWRTETPHPPTIGWVGGISHLEDLKLLSGQIAPLCEKYNFRFLMCGFHERTQIWADMERAITGKGRHERPKWFETREGTRPDIYGVFYSEIDIVLAPLKDEKFNRYKSELKILEAAAYKRPIVVSDVEPYTNHRNNLGVVFVTNNNWTDAIEFAINNQSIGTLNYDYCQQYHNIQDINLKRLEVIKSVINSQKG